MAHFFEIVFLHHYMDITIITSNGKKFKFVYRKNIQGNQYGRQEEIYECEDCQWLSLCRTLQENTS